MSCTVPVRSRPSHPGVRPPDRRRRAVASFDAAPRPVNLAGMAANQLVEVVFIAGTPRCGSTVLEAMLASRPGVIAVGELHYLWERGLVDNVLCSCGAPFRSCPFWRAVFDDAFGGMDEVDADRLLKLLQSLSRIRYIPFLRWPALQFGEYRRRFDEYAAIIGSVFNSIVKISGASHVVDSSKYGQYGFLLAAVPSLRVRSIHLVRDSRAVRNSWRLVRRRPEVHWEERDMERFSSKDVAWMWIWTNVVGDLLRRYLPGSRWVRYEDWARDETVREHLLDILGPPLSDAQAGASHSVSGNPVRFDPAATSQIRLDEAWRRDLPMSDYLVQTAATAPLLLAFGYHLGRRRPDMAQDPYPADQRSQAERDSA
jgi:Sulfotransferase family